MAKVKGKRKKLKAKGRDGYLHGIQQGAGPRASLSELRAALRIDRYNLDEDVERQPELFFEVAEAAALARSEQDLAKDSVDEVESRLDVHVREKAERKDERITEKEIKARIRQHPERAEAMKNYLGLKLETERLDQLRDSFKQRSYMLRELVALYLSSYYQDSTISGTRAGVRDARADRSQRRMSEKRRKRPSLKG